MNLKEKFKDILEELRMIGISDRDIAKEAPYTYSFLGNARREKAKVEKKDLEYLQEYFSNKKEEINKLISPDNVSKDSVIIDAYKTQKNFLNLSEELRAAQEKKIREKDKIIEELQKEVEKLRREIYDKLGRDLPKD